MPKQFRLSPYLFLLGLMYISLGVMIPAMSLIVTSRGYSLTQLSIAMVCFSVSVMALEVPSGMFADTQGRRDSFALGILLSLAGVVLLLVCSSFLLLCAGFSLTGIGRAFTTGSLDSLLVERGRDAGRKMEDLVFALEINSGICLGVGSLLGGVLLSVGSSASNLTNYVLLARLGVLFAALVLVFLLIKSDKKEQGTAGSLGLQLGRLVRSLTSTSFLWAYSLTILIQGLLLSSLEGYWQPFLRDLLASDSQLWVLGLVSAGIFIISALGSTIARYLIPRSRPKVIYCLFFASLFIMQLLLSRTGTVFSFLTLFILIYLGLGCCSVIGTYLFNNEVDDSVRTSLAGVSSLCLQTGGLAGNMTAALVFLYSGIPTYWLLVGTFGLVAIALLSPKLSKRPPSSAFEQPA